MSVLVLDEKGYEYVLNGFVKAGFQTQCDEYYSEFIRTHCKDKDVHDEANRLVKNWAILNELSFNAGYNDTGLDHYTLIDYNSLWKVDCYQLLKYIDCIIYNIEIETIEQHKPVIVPLNWVELKADYELLKTWKYELTRAIVTKRPEYDKAKWSDAPKREPLFEN